MRTRPITLYIFSIGMIAVAVSIPLQAIYIQDVENLMQSLTLLNIFVMLLCATTAVSVFNVHKSFRYLLPLTIATVLFNNWWVGYVGFNFSLLETSAASLGFLALCATLLEKNTFKVLRDPKLKWWNVAQRSKTEIPISLLPLRGEALTKKSYDISESGFFLQGLEKEELERFTIGEKFSVSLHFSKILKVRCTATIVRKSEAKGNYPTGLGLQFDEIDPRIKSTIKKLSQTNRDHEANF